MSESFYLHQLHLSFHLSVSIYISMYLYLSIHPSVSIYDSLFYKQTCSDYMYSIIVLYNCIVICIVRTIEYQSLVQCLCLQKDKGREIEREIENNMERYRRIKIQKQKRRQKATQHASLICQTGRRECQRGQLFILYKASSFYPAACTL